MNIMSELKVVAEFPFLVNKSFQSKGRPITVPAIYKQKFKEHGLIDSIHAEILFRNGPVIEGSIRVGLRAGGRYYQITMAKTEASEDINVSMGTKLMVRIMKSEQKWMIEIN